MRLEVPDLASRIAQKRAEVQEGEAKLAMLKAGPRTRSDEPERSDAIHARETEAAAAVLERLRQEALYLRDLQDKQVIAARSGGVMMTAGLAEKVGQYFREGEFICEVQDPSSLEAEVAMPEHVVARVRPGQSVELKARAVPFGTFRAQVVRIAPSAATSDAQADALRLADMTNTGETGGHVAVYCALSGPSAELRPGMTGQARVACGKQPVAKVLATRVLRYVRTEFWW